VAEYLASIPVAGGTGLVLGDEPNPATWVPAHGGGLIVRWVAGDDERHLLKRAATAPADVFGPPVANLRVNEPRLLLFDAAEPGSDIRGDSLAVTLDSGSYVVASARYRPDPQTQMIIHRFSRR